MDDALGLHGRKWPTKASAELLDFAMATSVAMVTVEADGRFSCVNPAACRLLGWPSDTLEGQSVDVIMPERFRKGHHLAMCAAAERGETRLTTRRVTVTACRRDGSEFPMDMDISLWRGADGPVFGAFLEDVTEHRNREAALIRQAYTDPLTGLANRQGFEAAVQEALDSETSASVVLIDLRHFSQINDLHGHAIGDTVLRMLSMRLQSTLPAGMKVARFGGDDMGVLLPGSAEDEVLSVCRILLDAIRRPIDVGSRIIHLDCNIGYALGKRDGDLATELIANADYGLYTARQSELEEVCAYHPSMREVEAARRALQDELIVALDEGQFELHYQPQFTTGGRRLAGFEALIRWRSPKRGLVSPGEFLPAVENSALAEPVGWWVLEEACRQIRAWRDAGLAPPTVAVNLFPAQYAASDLVHRVLGNLDEFDLEPECLSLEITEVIALRREDEDEKRIAELRDRGVKIALDDFGTGYASLATLRHFPLTTLKIDKAFVQDLGAEQTSTPIIVAIIAMARGLGLKTVAEGVEDKLQERALIAMACDNIQGFLYGRPAPAEVAAGYLNGATAVAV